VTPAAATKFHIAALVAAVLVLSSCSGVRIAYNNADVYLRWQANSYFGFEDEQDEELHARVAAFTAWHRKYALPDYVRITDDAARRLERGISREDLVWGYDSFQAQVRVGLRAAAAEIAGLLDRLGPEQLARLERRIAEENRKYAKDYLSGTVEERRKRRLKRNLERLEDWFGSLSDAQGERVRRYSERAPMIEQLRDRERRRLQAGFLEIVRARQAKARLPDFAANWDRDREPAYNAAVKAQRDEFFDMLLELDKTLSPAQRAEAVGRFREYAADFRTLASR
jgi:hypothetical protein